MHTTHTMLMNVLMAVLLVLAIAELVFSLTSLTVKGKDAVHSFRDTVSSISLGIGQQAINVYLAASFLALFAWVNTHLAIAHASMHVWWHWVILVLAADFSYYVGHRCGHKVNLFVAAHVVHHHAEDFNLISSLRQSWTAWILMFPFTLPIAFIGFPLEMFIYGQMGIMFFQFFAHAGTFRKKLGILDRIFITPNNHRVHHGAVAPYWGANCGGMFVIWDRIFGTFVEEKPEVPVVIGSGMKFNFYDPFEANLEYYRRIWFVSQRRQGLWQKFVVWFQSPPVLAKELKRLGYVPPAATDVNRTPLTKREMVTISVVVTATIGIFAMHRVLYARQPALVNAVTGISVMLSLWVVGRLLSGGFPKSASVNLGIPDVS